VQRKTFWNPCAIAASDEIEHFDNAASLLRATTELCVSEWASAHADILHTLSGGIDSSIVLSCLAHAPRKPHITCVNLYSRGGAGDERTFARIMAQHASVDLREIERDAQIDLSSFLECARTARPVLNFSAVDAEPVTRRLAYELGATAVFNGELGDNVFGRAAARQAVAEYLWQWGFRSTVLDIALDVAIQRRLSISSVLWRGLRDAAAHRLQRDWSVHRYAKRSGVYESRRQGLVSERFLDEYERHLERFIHPWFRDVRKVPPGRLPLIYAIAVVTSTFYHSPFGKPSDPPMIAPLASQPLAQLALRIPTHFHIIGGMSRAVALRAFSDSLPEAILSRDGKGTPESWIGDLVQRNRDFLREFLLDGQLAKQGILDREKTSALLSNRLGKSQVEPHQLIVQLYIEAWLSRWSGIEVRAAA
jgi:asparagine synthase (glutamine-hydrolysing)